MSHLTIASITAFLYAGATERDRDLTRCNDDTERFENTERFEKWEGHLGFVFYAERIATAIIEWLDERSANPEINDVYPGVIEYELIEPLGAQLIELWDAEQGSDVTLVMQLFQNLFFDWIAGDDDK